MKLPVIQGVIDRRILANYRVDPKVLAPLLPAPFQPKLQDGMGVVGICLIRFKGIRPAFLPKFLSFSSENAAHRVAVKWNEAGRAREGVYIWRRDTNSHFNSIAGGRLFPGVQRYAQFQVEECSHRLRIELSGKDGNLKVKVAGELGKPFPKDSLFKSLDQASEFFKAGACGYSTARDPVKLQGMELHCQTWAVDSLAIEEIASTFFDDPAVFPKGSIQFDCALLMRNIQHEWHATPDLESQSR